MILALTATREGLTPAQARAVLWCLAVYPAMLIHGGAVGGDTQLHEMICAGAAPDMVVDVYPASWNRETYWRGKATFANRVINVYGFSRALDRNRIMARRCDALLACPATAVETLRSGTWATVRYARKVGKLITLVMPDGAVLEERT